MPKPPAHTPSAMVGLNARMRPLAPAWITDTEVVDWGSFDRLADEACGALQGNGVTKGDRVAVLTGGSLWAWSSIFGILRAGAVCAPLNTLLRPPSIARMVKDAGARLLLVGDDYEYLAAEAIRENGMDGVDVLTQSRSGTVGRPFQTASGEGSNGLPATGLGPDDLCNIIYSSGTTGTPKGIVHSNAARMGFARMLAVSYGITPATRMLLSTPPHSNGSWAVVLPTAYAGGAVIQTKPFTPDVFLETVQRHRPTHALIVPAQARVIESSPKAKTTDFSCFRYVITVGSTMPVDQKRRFGRLCKGRLAEIYGLTEGVGTALQPEEIPDHAETVGRAFPECDLRIIDKDGRQVPPGEVGEIVGHSSMLMDGYWNRPEATQAVQWKAPDGTIMLRTGDLGSLDAEGYLTVRGRMKDMMVSGGLNVYPIDIEAIAMAHPDVADCAVIGVPSERWGETPVAFLFLKPGSRLDPASASAWINARVNKHERVHACVIHEGEFPRNALGKVMKADLARSYVDRQGIPKVEAKAEERTAP